MSSDHEAEIRASVAAHQDLGSGYDEAVAEGLVERIGAEIDKRIEARLESFAPQHGSGVPAGPLGWPGPPGVPNAPGAPSVPGAPDQRAPGDHQAPVGYQGYQGYMGPMLPPGYQLGPVPVRPASVGQRNVATTITALGSMGLGVGATAIVTRAANSAAQAIMVLLIWAAIAVINIAYARRHP
jgi:hypothetical protein